VLGLLLLLLRPLALVRLATGWPPTGWRLVMCSVGQGDLLVLPAPTDPAQATPDATPDTAVVVDSGPDPAAADRCLRDLGITKVPLVILTHFHADHSEGLPGVLRHRSVGAIETTTVDDPPGEEAKVRGWAAAARVPLVRVAPGEHRTAGVELSWDVLWPAGPLGPQTPGPNNASVSLLATVGGLRLALLGDLEPPAQAELLARARLGPVDVLKVAHHGSANQDWALAEALRPRLALISVGAGNPYGHPSLRTVDRLRALGATVLRTDRAGDLAVLGTGPTDLHALTHPHPPDNAHFAAKQE
jgi:competence protein ComEC